MKCPFCKHTKTKVTDKRLNLDNEVRRRRECLGCRKRFTTYEIYSENLQVEKEVIE